MRINQILQPNKTLLEDQRVAADIVSKILLELKDLTRPGVSLAMLDELAERRIRESGATPYNKGYQPKWALTPYPATLCASVDFEVCHAPPRGRTLQEGNIVKYDLGVRYKTGCGDAGLTVAVGEISNRKQRAMRYGLEALYEGIKVVKAGMPISAIGKAIENFVSSRGYTIIEEYSGHHIGKEMHEDPQIPHFYRPEDDNVFLKEGSVICLEPIITPGNDIIKISKEDGWTAFCIDGQPVVMFEEMLMVTKDSYEILTNHLGNKGKILL